MMKNDFRILVVDDEPELREAVKDLLSRNGYIVEQAVSGKDALVKTRNSPFHLVITDIVMPEMDGIALLKSLKQFDDELPVLMITGNSTVENASKPSKSARKITFQNRSTTPSCWSSSKGCMKTNSSNRERSSGSRRLSERMSRQSWANPGKSAKCFRRSNLWRVRRFGSDPGRKRHGQGTGGAVDSRAQQTKQGTLCCHQCRCCAAGPAGKRIFRTRKRRFLRAVERKFGLFEIANGGTLFLDEIAEMPMDLQAKMLRTVESRKLRRLGGTQEIAVDIRIVSATNRNLKEHIREKQFREDLYFRLCTFCIEIPPLRQRKEDIPLLAHHYLNNRGYRHATLSEDVLEALQLYEWPGNVRELENALERALLLFSRSSASPQTSACRNSGVVSKTLRQADSYHPNAGRSRKGTHSSSLRIYGNGQGSRPQTSSESV